MALILDVRDSAPAGPNSRPTLGGGTGLREKSRSAQHRSQQMRLKLARPAGQPPMAAVPPAPEHRDQAGEAAPPPLTSNAQSQRAGLPRV
jgi:hypothetical protein